MCVRDWSLTIVAYSTRHTNCNPVIVGSFHFKQFPRLLALTKRHQAVLCKQRRGRDPAPQISASPPQLAQDAPRSSRCDHCRFCRWARHRCRRFFAWYRCHGGQAWGQYGYEYPVPECGKGRGDASDRGEEQKGGEVVGLGRGADLVVGCGWSRQGAAVRRGEPYQVCWVMCAEW